MSMVIYIDDGLAESLQYNSEKRVLDFLQENLGVEVIGIGDEEAYNAWRYSDKVTETLLIICDHNLWWDIAPYGSELMRELFQSSDAPINIPVIVFTDSTYEIVSAKWQEDTRLRIDKEMKADREHPLHNAIVFKWEKTDNGKSSEHILLNTIAKLKPELIKHDEGELPVS